VRCSASVRAASAAIWSSMAVREGLAVKAAKAASTAFTLVCCIALPARRLARSRRRRSRPLSCLHGLIIARIDRLFQEPFRIVGPELAHRRIGLDRLVDHLAALLLDAADVDVAHDVVVVVEADRAAR